METINSSDVRTKWSATFDEVFYRGPKLIEKGNRINILLSGPMLSNWLSQQYPLSYSHTVVDYVHMVSLDGIPDVFGFGDTAAEALASLYEHLTVLTHDLFSDFARYSQEHPNDIPYLIQFSMLELEETRAQVAVTLDG